MLLQCNLLQSQAVHCDMMCVEIRCFVFGAIRYVVACLWMFCIDLKSCEVCLIGSCNDCNLCEMFLVGLGNDLMCCDVFLVCFCKELECFEMFRCVCEVF